MALDSWTCQVFHMWLHAVPPLQNMTAAARTPEQALSQHIIMHEASAADCVA